MSEVLNGLSWWTKLWTWFRKWGWIPVAVLLLILGAILGGVFLRRRDGLVAVNPLRDIRKAVEDNNRKIDAELYEAALDRDRQVIEIEQEHAATLARLDEDQKARAAEYRDNPQRLSRWLNRLADEQD